MLYYLKKYPISLFIIVVVIYLSFFRPPTLDLPPFPYYDKIVHFCMYAGMAGMLWLEFLLNHRNAPIPFLRGLVGGTLAPILFSGIIELLQENFTTYRGGEWLDFLSNTVGVLVATAVAWFMIRPWLAKHPPKTN